MKYQILQDLPTFLSFTQTAIVFGLALLSFLVPKRGKYNILFRLVFGPARLSFRLVWWLVKILFKGLRRLFRAFRKPQGPLDLTIEQIDRMGNGDGRDFEAYVASLYRGMGHEAYTTTELREMGKLPRAVMAQAGVGEQGVDVVVDAKTEEGPKRIIIQCKHYSQKVGNKAVQEIFSAMNLYRADKAVVISNQEFTAPARALARENQVRLIGRDELPQLVKNAVKIYNQNKVA